jgi:hypothetical protein
LSGQEANQAKLIINKAYTAPPSPLPSGTTPARIKAASLEFHGHIVSPDWWRQLFSGFNPGDVRGSFGHIHEVYPEWWGLETDAGKTEVDGGRHDRAINCAIRSVEAASPRYSPAAPFESFIAARVGRVVALAPRTYYVSAPLDLSGVSSQLRGADT